MAIKRQLAAIMFTDITGYSAMMGADEEYARKIRNRHRKVFRESHEAHSGKILQYYGDGTLSIFESAAAAVECAVDMQIEYRREPEVPLRIGIHTGDISYDDEGAYGDGLNIAARIERLCVPGGVFISAKVYDDIKNHSWLTAISLGDFRLRNIHREVELFAVTCKGMAYPTREEVQNHPEYKERLRPSLPDPLPEDDDDIPAPAPITGSKSKGVATLLAFFFGFFGIHRFYLGQRKKGMTHLILSILAIVLTARGMENPIPPVVIFAIIGFVDFILLLAMSRYDFNLKYNTGTPELSRRDRRKVRRQQQHAKQPAPVRPPQRVEEPANKPMMQGIAFYKREQYHEAMRSFHKALEIDPDSPAIFFNLACCASILGDHEAAFRFLERSVECGFDDFDRIDTHEALAYIRDRSEYAAFANNGYRIVQQLPEPEADELLESLDKFNPDILDKLEHLGELLERGDLSRQEFEDRKKEILGNKR